MKLFTVQYTKDALERVPPDERVTFLMACQLANDNQILKKQALAGMSFTSDIEVLRNGHIASLTLNLRLWAGRLHEGWVFQQSRLGRLCKLYEAELPDESKEAWKRLNAYFGQPNALISRLRNKVGFHADYEVALLGYQALRADEPLTDYVAREPANCLYFGAELAITLAMIHLTGESDVGEGLSRICKELMEVGNWFDSLIIGVTEVFHERHLGSAEEGTIELEGLPRLDRLAGAYFFDPAKSDQVGTITEVV